MHPLNALSPMDVTLSGMVIEANDEQPLNAYLPIDVTLSGMVIDVKDLQSSKAL